MVEPQRGAISAKRRIQWPYAVRKPKDYVPVQPWDLVQVDALDIRPVAGVVLKQFTARDVISKWDVIEARCRATAKTAKEFIDTLHSRMPFPIRAMRVDGDSAFYAEFGIACKDKGIKLFVLPPKSPKPNGSVERANRTHTEEFYEVNECSWTIPELNKQLLGWEQCLQLHKTPPFVRKQNPLAIPQRPWHYP